MRRNILVLGTLLCMLLPAAPAGAQSDTATVTLVHGFRGLLADVYLDGEPILEGFEPARSTDPTKLPAGSHDVAVREADAAPDSKPIVEGSLELEAGANLSAVVHPDANGEPTISVFDNAVEPPGQDRARAVVRHTAVAPDIDVEVGNKQVASGLAPGDEARGGARPGSRQVTATASDSGEQLLAPARISVDGDVVVALYLIGSADDDSLGWLSQRLDTGAGTTPVGVPTGNSGLAATSSAPPWSMLALSAMLALGVMFALGMLRTRRPQPVARRVRRPSHMR